MPPRQLWMFQFGCWSSLAAALIHLAGHIVGRRPPVNDTEQRLLELAAGYSFTLIDGRSRTLMDFINGLSLNYAVLLAAMGAIVLLVARRASDDARLMSAIARMCALASVVLLVIALTRFSVLSAVPLAVMATCFLVASVEAPREVGNEK